MGMVAGLGLTGKRAPLQAWAAPSDQIFVGGGGRPPGACTCLCGVGDVVQVQLHLQQLSSSCSGGHSQRAPADTAGVR